MPSAAFFDLDKTLWACVGEKSFAHHQLSIGGISLRQFSKIIILQLRYDLHLIDGIESLKRRVIRELFIRENIEKCIDAYEKLFHDRLFLSFFPDMLSQIDRHRLAGDKIVIVSAAIDFIASTAAEYLKADDYYATVLETRHGQFSGEVKGSIPFGKVKAKIVEDYALKHSLDLNQCYAYGDHWEDRHMLNLVGNPVAINPDTKLMHYAKQHSWETRIVIPAKHAGHSHPKRFLPRIVGKNP